MQNKFKYIAIIMFMLLLILSSCFVLLFDYTRKLENQLNERDKLISDVKSIDSLYVEKTKQYNDTLTKYINNCDFYVNGKPVSTSKIVKIINDALRENGELTDSLWIYKKITNFVWRDYGISYTIEKNGEEYSFLRSKVSKTDSALLLFPYFKDRLTKDSISGKWIITRVINK